MVVDHSELLVSQFKLFCESEHIVKNRLRTKHFRLFVSQLFRLKEVERTRKGSNAHVSDPELDLVFA